MASSISTINLRNEYIYFDDKNRKIKIINENGRIIFKSINRETILDFYAPIVTRKLNSNKNINRTINHKNIKKAEKIMNELLSNKKIKIAAKTLIGLSAILMIVLLKTPVMAAELTEASSIAASAEMATVTNFISLVITTMRVVATSISALIAANSGIKTLTEENADGPREAKKAFQKILWALFLVYAATGLASLLAKKLLGGL